MIGLLIGWLIVGILLVFFSSLIYYYNTVGLLGFSAILLLGIVILGISAFHFVSSQTKWKASGLPNTEALKSMLSLFMVFSIIVFILGAFGYLLGTLGIYNFDPQTKNTLLVFLAVGVLSAVGSILSWIYVERGMPDAIVKAIKKRLNKLEELKNEINEKDKELQSKIKELTQAVEDSRKHTS